MCFINFIQKHYNDYQKGKKNDEVKKLKKEFLYKQNIISSFLTILIQIYLAYTIKYNSVDKSKRIAEIAATIWVIANITKVIIFFLALIYKPLHKTLLIIHLILWISFLFTGL